MKSKARLKKAEQAAAAITPGAAPRLFVYFTDHTSQPSGSGEITGTVEGEEMTLAEWLKVKRPGDLEQHVRFVDEVTAGRDDPNG